MNYTQEFLLALAIVFAFFLLLITILILVVIDYPKNNQPVFQPMIGQTAIIQINDTQVADDIGWCLTHD